MAIHLATHVVQHMPRKLMQLHAHNGSRHGGGWTQVGRGVGRSQGCYADANQNTARSVQTGLLYINHLNPRDIVLFI